MRELIWFDFWFLVIWIPWFIWYANWSESRRKPKTGEILYDAAKSLGWHAWHTYLIFVYSFIMLIAWMIIIGYIADKGWLNFRQTYTVTDDAKIKDNIAVCPEGFTMKESSKGIYCEKTWSKNK